MPNMTHVAELNAVPGYTCVVDEPTSLGVMGKERFCSSIGDDIILSVDSSSNMSQKQASQTVSHMPHDDTALRSYDSDRRSGRACSASMSNGNSTFASASDINLRTEPSYLLPPFRTPPIPAERKGDFSRLKPDPKGPVNFGLEATVDAGIPFFEMEVDASSSAAASAAAMRDAMEKAQAKLKAAKVSMDRKKGSLQNGDNLGLKADVNGGERGQMLHDECASKDERLRAATHRASAKIKGSGEDRHARNATQILPNNSDVEQHTGGTEKPAERNNGKKRGSFVDAAFAGGVGEWKEATQYYEFVNGDVASLASQWPSNGDGKTATAEQQSIDEKHNSDSADEVCLPEGNRRKLKATKAVSRQGYYEKMVKVAQEVHNTMMGGHAEAEKGLGGLPKQQRRKPEKNERQAQQAEGKPHVSIGEEGEIRLKDASEKEEAKHKEQESRGGECSDRNRNGPDQRIVLEDCERRMRESVFREANEQRAEEASERQKEKKLAGTPKPKDNWSSEVEINRSKEAFDVGFGRELLQTVCESRENDEIKDLRQSKVEDNRKKEACDNVVGPERLQKTCNSNPRKLENERSNEALEDISSEERLQRNSENQENIKINEYEGYAEDAVDGRGTQKALQEAGELEDGRKHREAPEQEKMKEKMDEAEKLVVDSKGSVKNQKQETSEARLEESAKEGQIGSESMQADELEETSKVPDNTGDHGNEKTVHKSQVKINVVDEQASNSSLETGLSSKDFELDNMTSRLSKLQMEAHDSLQVPAEEDNREMSTVPAGKESKLEAVETADVHYEKLMESTVSHVGDTSGGVCTETLNHENKKVVPSGSDPKLADACKIEREEKRRASEEVQVLYDEEKVRVTPAEGNNGWSELLRRKEAAHTDRTERPESIQKKSEPPGASQSPERKGKIITEEKNKQKERDLEQEQLRKLEEEKEREREREKDRMAVEVAIREARERAYTDARDRAALERATDEARQRAMAEARGRLEKACAEARERSLADKASEARLRAERAAVERATAEARQRAIEKVMAERVALEAQDRMQRSVSEKYSSEREPVMRQSSMPSISERFEAADGEPVERCKARLERHCRTVERVAKALAEKNMRDLLAQREQAERNRLAETLDADIKRWSSSKEGNLRALLSTLQYILGPESGWHPIPLTEVITAAAVKKAYRKATLCVHPDKLQQRGASIQQKYICEKVFDLLKEAWNRFNSEEK